MCKFLSVVTAGNGKPYFFDAKIRKALQKSNPKNYQFDSHTSIASYFELVEDRLNKYEYDPIEKKFTIDQINNKHDDSADVEKWYKKFVKSKDFDALIDLAFGGVKTFNDACILCKTTEKNFNATFRKLGLSSDTIAYEKLKIIARAINNGWMPNWNNTNQPKYYPYFRLSSGFGFSDTGYGYESEYSHVGSRLCFETAEKAEYAGKQFVKIYEDYMTIKK